MPDSNDYREVAVQLNRSADDVRAINGPVASAFGPDVLSGGSFAGSVERFIFEAGVVATAIAADLEALAADANTLSAQAEEQELAMATATIGAIPV